MAKRPAPKTSRRPPGAAKKRPPAEAIVIPRVALDRMPSIRFPAPWLWLVDEAIPSFVKARYSPRDSWKDKPFGKEDVRFFAKGVNELSELFTEERTRRSAAYFQHPRFRSSYLLYFVPLQAAKFLTLFQLHPGALEAAIKDARARGGLRVLDLGAGPGTASIALLLAMIDPPPALRKLIHEDPFPIELDWWDTDRGVMEDGRALAEQLASAFPSLRGRVLVRTHVGNWWEAPQARSGHPYSLTFLGHVLNESTGPSSDPESLAVQKAWHGVRERAGGAGALIVEPAARRSSQQLSQLRDRLLATEEPPTLWGPCLHAGACPMADGRDWCHFSVPVQIPGEWFREFSRGLGSERNWLKFSYLWLASAAFPAPAAEAHMRRVISDPLGGYASEARLSEVLTCEPENPGRAHVPASQEVRRGDIIRGAS